MPMPTPMHRHPCAWCRQPKNLARRARRGSHQPTQHVHSLNYRHGPLFTPLPACATHLLFRTRCTSFRLGRSLMPTSTSPRSPSATVGTSTTPSTRRTAGTSASRLGTATAPLLRGKQATPTTATACAAPRTPSRSGRGSTSTQCHHTKPYTTCVPSCTARALPLSACAASVGSTLILQSNRMRGHSAASTSA